LYFAEAQRTFGYANIKAYQSEEAKINAFEKYPESEMLRL
jgi:hypothetical protein